MHHRFAAMSILALTLVQYAGAAPDTRDAVLVDLQVERDGQPVLSPRLLIRVGQLAEAQVESRTGGDHRVLLSVSRDTGIFHVAAKYLTRLEDEPWVVVAEPTISVREAVAGSMVLKRGGGELRFNVEVSGGASADLRTRLSSDAVSDDVEAD